MKMNYKVSCIKVALDFVSPENLGECFRLIEEFCTLLINYRSSEDKLEGVGGCNTRTDFQILNFNNTNYIALRFLRYDILKVPKGIKLFRLRMELDVSYAQLPTERDQSPESRR
ncbi:hypothetical protein Ahy_A06g028561 [Arachis hypogaea]|uniref:Uncharacterized protein n=1 Tax=Arachis hypogaea TaxID=3818 RepID=A0A445CRE1_ARAHY|nr:hypothetical protein Ahy_A06g028561 [Arachis hypogaea]